MGLFGESGRGKTTLGRIIAGVVKPTDGYILYEGGKVKYPYKGRAEKKGSGCVSAS